MPNRKKNQENDDVILYWIIAILLLLLSILIYLLYEANLKIQPVYQSVEIEYDEEGRLLNPTPVEKPEGVLRAEEDLKIVRNVRVDDEGYIVIEAYLKNLDRLEDELIVQDMVETLRFDQRIELEDGEVDALSGRLFPQGKSINLASWGAGPQSEKKSKINVSVIDLNLDSSIRDLVGLYSVRFKSDVVIDTIYFDDVELRHDEFILSFGEEEISI